MGWCWEHPVLKPGCQLKETHVATGSAVGSGGVGSSPGMGCGAAPGSREGWRGRGVMGAVLLQAGCGCTAVLTVPQQPGFTSPLDSPLSGKVKCGMV